MESCPADMSSPATAFEVLRGAALLVVVHDQIRDKCRGVGERGGWWFSVGPFDGRESTVVVSRRGLYFIRAASTLFCS